MPFILPPYGLHLWKSSNQWWSCRRFWTSFLDFDLKNLVAVQSVSRSKRRAAHKIKLGKTSSRRKSLCIALLRASSCSNFHRLKMNILYGKIVWLKFALIWTTIFICRRFGLMTFFKTDCFHTEQDQNYIITKVWWKLGESFHLPITEIKSYIKRKLKIKNDVQI